MLGPIEYNVHLAKHTSLAEMMILLPKKNSSPPTNTLTLPLNDVLYLPQCNVPVSVQGGLFFGFVFEEKTFMYQFPSNLSRVGGRGRGLALACVQGQERACYRLKHNHGMENSCLQFG